MKTSDLATPLAVWPQAKPRMPSLSADSAELWERAEATRCSQQGLDTAEPYKALVIKQTNGPQIPDAR